MSKAVKRSADHELKFAQNHKTIYADHIMRFAFGPVVSKLDLGISRDLGDQLPEISTTVVIPTPSLLDVLPLIIEQSKNPEIQNEMISKLKNIIAKFEEA
ncbi:hypothetical protein APC57_03970 [Acinetobacter baumannii]|uniref:hypothetical protein n=1 Tax=Acinetobacter baumannii TaxID=470 RepID=UPI0007077CF3|nr:hypothetical protein [Acinetobacter baumannii]KQG97046.1 hypothetical protein APC57_03970 [Acinetobacter baumannii]